MINAPDLVQGGVRIPPERLQPVKTIIPSRNETLRTLLQRHGVLDEVKSGTAIVLLDGKSLTNLDTIVAPNRKIAVISIELLGGG